MSFVQCSGCEAEVDITKAYCPDCGMPMDEEQKRKGSSEFDSVMKTQNLSPTTQYRLMEQFNLSTVFKLPKDANESKAVENNEPAAVENKVESVPLNVPPETRIEPKPPENKSEIENKSKLVAKINQLFGGDSDSKTLLYVTFGVVSLFLVLALISVIILGILFWNYSK